MAGPTLTLAQAGLGGGGGGSTAWEVITGLVTGDVGGIDAAAWSGAGGTVSETGGVTTITLPDSINRTFWSNGMYLPLKNGDQGDWIATLLAKPAPLDWIVEFEVEVQGNGWDKVDGTPFFVLGQTNVASGLVVQQTATTPTYEVDHAGSGTQFPAAGETLAFDTLRYTIYPGDNSNHGTGGENAGTSEVTAFLAGSRVWKTSRRMADDSLTGLASEDLRLYFHNFATHANGTATLNVIIRARLVDISGI